jgi:TPR repeat protein
MSKEDRRRSKASALFERADAQWKRGAHRSAFRLFLKAAKVGDRGSQVNVGYFYDRGIGVRRNRDAAVYWYKRAYRRGDSCGATNIGTIYRDEHKISHALSWFRKAVRLGDDGSNLHIAKYYLDEHCPEKAIELLNKVRESQTVAESETEEAMRLLRIARLEIRRRESARLGNSLRKRSSLRMTR